MKIRMCLINLRNAVLVPDKRICVYDRARFWLAQPGRALSSGGRGRKFTKSPGAILDREATRRVAGRTPAIKSSHPDQLFFIELNSCCLFGRYHELTISPLPEFCLTSINGNLPATKALNPGNPCLPECSAHEH